MPDGRLTIAVFHERSAWSLPEPAADAIRKAAPPGLEVVQARDSAQLAELLPGTTHLVGFPLTAEQTDPAAHTLRWVQLTHSIGDATPALERLASLGVRLCTAASIRAPQAAEHALALTLAMFREIDDALAAQREHRWAAKDLAARVRTIAGSTVGLLAVGAVAQALAARLRAFDAEVLACVPIAGEPPAEAHQAFAATEISQMLVRCDALIVAAPRVDDTVGMLRSKQLDVMRPNAVLVDISRGGIVHEPSLLRALRRGRLGGAALDAFTGEPLASTSPLWTMPNVLITPHVAAASPHFWDHAVGVIARHLHALAEGAPIGDEAPPSWYARSAS